MINKHDQIYKVIRLLVKAGEWSTTEYSIDQIKEALKELVFLNYQLEQEIKKK